MKSVAQTRVDELEHLRPRLTGLAYRMLGSVAEAEDVVQDVALRYLGVSPGEVQAPDRYLTSMTARACIDQSRSARRRREMYVGPWLPEPMRLEGSDDADPSKGLERAESISMAFLILLQTLSPLERAAFVLHDILDFEYSEIADLLGRKDAACRQLVSRARTHVRGRRKRFDAPGATTQRLAERFLEAARGGDLEGLVQLLAKDATLWVDGGGKVAAATNPVFGAERVARYWVGLFRKVRMLEAAIEEINGAPAIVLRNTGRLVGTVSIEVTRGRIRSLFNQRNPEKLVHVRNQD